MAKPPGAIAATRESERQPDRHEEREDSQRRPGLRDSQREGTGRPGIAEGIRGRRHHHESVDREHAEQRIRVGDFDGLPVVFARIDHVEPDGERRRQGPCRPEAEQRAPPIETLGAPRQDEGRGYGAEHEHREAHTHPHGKRPQRRFALAVLRAAEMARDALSRRSGTAYQSGDDGEDVVEHEPEQHVAWLDAAALGTMEDCQREDLGLRSR